MNKEITQEEFKARYLGTFHTPKRDKDLYFRIKEYLETTEDMSNRQDEYKKLDRWLEGRLYTRFEEKRMLRIVRQDLGI